MIFVKQAIEQKFEIPCLTMRLAFGRGTCPDCGLRPHAVAGESPTRSTCSDHSIDLVSEDPETITGLAISPGLRLSRVARILDHGVQAVPPDRVSTIEGELQAHIDQRAMGCHVCGALPHQWCYSVDGVSYMHAMRLENVNLMAKMRAAVEAAQQSEPSTGRDLGLSASSPTPSAVNRVPCSWTSDNPNP